MNKKELILQILGKMGYKPELDNDGDIMFRFEAKTVFVMTGDDDEKYLSVQLPQFYEVAEGEEPLVLTVCNRMSRELKLVKVYIDQTFKNVTGACEFFYSNEESLSDCLAHSLRFLGIVRSRFKRYKAELSED